MPHRPSRQSGLLSFSLPPLLFPSSATGGSICGMHATADRRCVLGPASHHIQIHTNTYLVQYMADMTYTLTPGIYRQHLGAQPAADCRI
jgi:hypothetical protein